MIIMQEEPAASIPSRTDFQLAQLYFANLLTLQVIIVT